jgi:hypothetical protein
LDRREIKSKEVGERCIMRSFVTCTLRQVKLNDVKEGVGGRASETHRGVCFGGKARRYDDVEAGGRISKWILER